jgi:hypothetical protein
MKIVHIRPVNGSRVLDPVQNLPLPEEGQPVELTTYWKRRLAAGEVEIVKTGGDNKADKRKE